MEEIQELVAALKDSQSEKNLGMTKVEGELQSFVEKRLSELPGANGDGSSDIPIDERTIFHLPDHEMKKELCEPKVVSIGPYHRGKPSLQTMEHYKWFTLRKFLESNSKVDLTSCLQAMKALEADARMLYSEPVDLGSDDFALMLLLDSCFILEWLSKVCDYLSDNTRNFDIFFTGWHIIDIFYDLCLMENQIPFRVIHYLMAITKGMECGTLSCGSSVARSCPLVKLINEVFELSNNTICFIIFKPIDCCHDNIHHLLHFYHCGVAVESSGNENGQQGRSHNFCRPDVFPCFKCFACLSRKPASDSTRQTQNDQGKSPNLFQYHCFSCSKLFPRSHKAASDSTQQTQNDQGKSPNLFRCHCFSCSKLIPRSHKAASDSTQQTQNDQGKSPNLFRSHCFSCSKLFTRSCKAASDNKEGALRIMCVSELCDAGVKFKKKKTPKGMWDISFENGTIEMPLLGIDRSFVRILWNLVAYEQINFATGNDNSFSSYLALMDSLINTEKDVSILERAGIVDNYFSNAEEAAAYFNQFSKLFVLTYGDHYFTNLFKQIKDYGDSTWPKYRAKLVQDYFSNPWTIISVGAAVALFALTILQTYYSAMSV